MMTEKIRVSASSVMSSAAETRLTASSCRADGPRSGCMAESVPLPSMLASATLGRAFVGAAVLWALALPLAPFAVVQTVSVHVWYGFALGVYAVGSLVCHQLPARSFHLWSVPLPVCARCTGIYAGAAIAAVGGSLKTIRVKSGRTRRVWRYRCVLPAVPAACYSAVEWAQSHASATH